MREQMDRKHRSMFALLIAWAIYVCILPFIYSSDLIMLMLGILLLLYGQFLVVMNMD